MLIFEEQMPDGKLRFCGEAESYSLANSIIREKRRHWAQEVQRGEIGFMETPVSYLVVEGRYYRGPTSADAGTLADQPLPLSGRTAREIATDEMKEDAAAGFALNGQTDEEAADADDPS